MKKFLLLFLFISQIGLAAQEGGNSVFRFGSSPQVDNPSGIIPASQQANIITLTMEVGSSTSNHFYRLMKMNSPGSVAQYQVPNGKTFYALGYYVQVGTSQVCLLYGYGTAALIADDTATAPTGNVPYSGSSGLCGHRIDIANVNKFMPIPMSFPQNTYPYVYLTNSSVFFTVQVIGIEK